jgi:hypothetical protein
MVFPLTDVFERWSLAKIPPQSSNQLLCDWPQQYSVVTLFEANLCAGLDAEFFAEFDRDDYLPLAANGL